MTKTNQNFSFVRSDDHTVTFAITDASDNPKSLTSAVSIDWKAVQIGGTGSISKALGSGITLTNVNGVDDGVVVTLASSDTTVPAGVYRHELETEIGGKKSTLATGILTVTADIIEG